MAHQQSASRLLRGELARRAGCNIETVRYYEKAGLLPAPPRTASGYRTYDGDHLRRLRFILRSRELGFGVAEVQGLLALVDGGSQTCAEVKLRTERHLVDIRAKIADLQRIETVLEETAARCTGDETPDCPILETLAD